MTLEEIQDAAIDGQDWPTVALAILSDPISQRFTSVWIGCLAQIGFGLNIGYPVADVQKFIHGVCHVIDEVRNHA